MYFQVASGLVVTYGTDGYTQPISMDDYNAMQVDIVTYVKGGGDITVTPQGSNDLDNWSSSDITGSGTISNPGFATFKATVIAWRYIRFKITQASSGTGIVDIGANTSKQ